MSFEEYLVVHFYARVCQDLVISTVEILDAGASSFKVPKIVPVVEYF